MGVLAGPLFGEKGSEELAAFGLANPRGDGAPVIQGGELEEVECSSGGPALRVGRTEDDPLTSGVDHGTGAHGAGFLGDVQGAVGETPVPNHLLRLGQCQHLGMGGGILQSFHLVARAGDDPTVADDDATDRHFLLLIGAYGLSQGFPHEIGIRDEVDDGFGSIRMRLEKLPEIRVNIGIGVAIGVHGMGWRGRDSSRVHSNEWSSWQ
jgi:hypothetical protein